MLAKNHPSYFCNTESGGYKILLSKTEICEAEAIKRAALIKLGKPPEWSDVGIVYEDEYIVVLRDAVRFPDDSLGTYMRILSFQKTGDGVAILPKIGDKIVLLRHFRHATRQTHLEIPRGFGKPGTTVEENASRELIEETGASIREIIQIGSVFPDTGIRSDRVYIYFAEIESIGSPDSYEAITALETYSVDETEKMIKENVITDAFTIVCFTKAKLLGLI